MSLARPTGPDALAAAMAARRQYEQRMATAHGQAAEQASYGVAPPADRGPDTDPR